MLAGDSLPFDIVSIEFEVEVASISRSGGGEFALPEGRTDLVTLQTESVKTGR